jgi:acyl carrier protein
MHPTRQMKSVTPDNVREFLLKRYYEPIIAMQLNFTEIPDDFDLLLSGVIDSFGILEMISAIEDEFRIQLDLALLDAEDLTRIGPLAQYIAERGQDRR